MRIIIKPGGPKSQSVRGVELSLPASKVEMLDALDQAKIPYGSSEYLLEAHRDSPGYVKKMLGGLLGSVVYNPSLAEMNHLAERIEQLSEHMQHTMDGVIQIRGSYSIGDIIDATHNLHLYSFYPGVSTDYELGEAAIDSDGGLYPPIIQVPVELLECLDPEKVGAIVRREDQGAFTKMGYVVPDDVDWEPVYDGKSLSARAMTLRPDEPIISLRLRPYDSPDESTCEFRLDLPAYQSNIDDVLKQHDINDLSSYIIHGATSVIPALDYAISPGEDIEKVNELAFAIRVWCIGGFAKYKAAYEMEQVSDIESAIDLAKRLSEYDFEQHPSTEAFGRAAMAKTGADITTMAEYGFDFEAYGSKVMDEKNICFTHYGFVSHLRGQQKSIEQTQKSEPEPEQSLEPTMNM